MKTTVTETRNYDQNVGETRLIEHENRLFKVYYKIDHSYHFQSNASLEIWTEKGFENITNFNLFKQFQVDKLNYANVITNTIDLEAFTKFYEEQIKNFVKYLPKKEIEN